MAPRALMNGGSKLRCLLEGRCAVSSAFLRLLENSSGRYSTILLECQPCSTRAFTVAHSESLTFALRFG